MKIHSDLNKLSEWCERNSLFLNVDKCKTITFSKTCYPVEFAYMLAGTVLDRVSSKNDLEVIMDGKMNFSEHVDVMVGKAFAMLGFIRRLSFKFQRSIHSKVPTRLWFFRSWSTPALYGVHE
jgi:hypothetical protein